MALGPGDLFEQQADLHFKPAILVQVTPQAFQIPAGLAALPLESADYAAGA